MTFIDAMKEKARKDIKNIVLPEADDVRVLKATIRKNKNSIFSIITFWNYHYKKC